MPTEYTKNFERIVIEVYLKTRTDIDYSEVHYPDPPDCIVKLTDGSKIWIEVTSVYRNKTLAKNVNSGQCGKMFHEYLGTNSEHRNNLIDKIIEVVKKKESKQNYKQYVNEYGKGILIAYIDDPLSTPEDLSIVIEKAKTIVMPLANFHSIFLYIRPVQASDLVTQQESFLKGFFPIVTTNYKHGQKG